MTPEQRRKRWAGSLPTSQTIVQNHWHVYAASSNNARRINVHQTDVVFKHACALGCEGIVSKRIGSRYRSGRSKDWLKLKNPDAPAAKREAEEDWGRGKWQTGKNRIMIYARRRMAPMSSSSGRPRAMCTV